MKKLISVLLIFLLLVSIAPLDVVAESVDKLGSEVSSVSEVVEDDYENKIIENTDTEDEYIYYSDLFYGYSHYLKNAPYMVNYYTDTQDVLNLVYNEFMDSSDFSWAIIKESLVTAVDLKEWTKLIADASGLTTFTYNDALDAANEDFAKHLIGNFEVADAYGTELKYVKRINDIAKVYKTFDDAYDVSVMTETEIFSAMFATIKDTGVIAYIDYTTLTKLQNDILPDISSITSKLSAGADALTAAKVIAIGIVMEDLRMELIDEILALQSSGTMLYDGMTRLKNQLRNGFVSYFIDNYLTEKVLNELADSVVKKLTEVALGDQTATFKLIGAVTKVASWIVFDCIFDIPDIDDLTKQMVLSEYSYSLYGLVSGKIDAFSSPFETTDIFAFESMFTAYVAATKAALEASKKIELDSNADRLANVIDKYTDADIYYRTIESAKNSIYSTLVSYRDVTDFGEWKVTDDRVLTSASDVIEKSYIYAPNQGIYADFTVYVNKTLTVFEGMEVTVHGNITLKGRHSYWNGTEYGSLINNGELYISNDIISSSKGNIITSGGLNVGGSVSTTHMTVSGDSNTIMGDLVVENSSVSNAHLTFSSGSLEVLGNCTVDNSLVMTNKDDYLLVHGNFKVGGYGSNKLTAGTVELKGDFTKYNNDVNYTGYYEIGTHKTVFSGTETQNITIEGHRDSYGTRYKNQFANLVLENSDIVFTEPIYQLVLCQDTVITNPALIKVIYNLDLNGYRLTVAGDIDAKTLNTNSGGLNVGGSVNVNNMTVTVDSNVAIKKNLTLNDNLNNNGELKITGNITCASSYNYLINNGKLIVEGNLDFSKNPFYVEQSFKDAVIEIGGNFLVYGNKYCKITTGKVIFNGIEQQMVKYLKAPTIILDNESDAGVVFTSSVTSSVLFDHKGNNFTLYNDGSESSFVDYDGDGLKDNVDPEPTVHAGYNWGDVNFDGEVSISDVTLLQKYLVSLEIMDEKQLVASDVDNDGKVSIRDVTYIQMYIAKLASY